jgi:hypothetical protein
MLHDLGLVKWHVRRRRREWISGNLENATAETDLL